MVIPEILSIFYSAFLLLFCLYVSGSLLWILVVFYFPNAEQEGFTVLFLKLTLGFLGILSAFAIVSTQGKTIILIALPIFLFIVWKAFLYYSKQPFSGFLLKKEIKPLVITSCLLVVFILLRMLKIGYFHSGAISPRLLEDDYFYIALARFMPLLSLENATPWYSIFAETPPYVRNPEAYHYGELWFLSFSLKVGTCAPIYLLRIVLQAIGLSICWLGFGVLLLQYCPPKTSYWIIGGIAFLLITQWGYIPKYSGGTGTGFTLMLAFKGLPGLLMIQFAWLLFSYKALREKHIYIIPFCLLPILNILFAPSILAAAGFAGTYLWLKTKTTNSLVLIGAAVATVLWIIFFYGLTSGFPSLSEGETHSNSNLFYYISIAGSTLGLTLADHLLHYFPIVPGIIYYGYKVFFKGFSIRFLFLIMGFAGITEALLFYHKESFQFTYICFWACNAFVYLQIFGKTLQEFIFQKSLKKPAWGYIFLISFFLQYLPGQFSEYRPKPMLEKDISSGTTSEFVQKISEKIGDTRLIAYWNKNEPEKGHLCNDCAFTGFVAKPVWVVTLNTPETVAPGSDYAVRVSQTPLYSFIQSLKSQKQYTNYENAQVAFLQKYKIPGLLAPIETDLPPKLREYIKDSVIMAGSTAIYYELKL